MIWYVAAGSAVGGVARFLVSGWAQRWGVGFPVGTLLVNVIGSFALGFLLRYGLQSAVWSPEVRALLTIGFCGGFTTFSTFSYETVALVEDGVWLRAFGYLATSLVLSLAAILVGMALARMLVTGGHAT